MKKEIDENILQLLMLNDKLLQFHSNINELLIRAKNLNKLGPEYHGDQKVILNSVSDQLHDSLKHIEEKKQILESLVKKYKQ